MVLNYISENRTSIRETAAIFNIPTHSLIIRWRKEFETKGIDDLTPKKKERPLLKKETNKPTPAEGSVEALHAEVKRLKMENAYLKKLNALVQNKEKLQNKMKRK